jgi:DNA-binding NarL/FixJ family response regulator
MNPIKILLSDFQYLTREGLVNMIERHEDFELVGVNNGPEGLITTILQRQPDLLVLDYQSQDPILLSVLKQVLAGNATNILVITNDDNKEHIQKLLDLGVKGIVTKKCSKLEIVNAIYSAAKSNRFFCNRILDILMETQIEDKEVNCEPADLSPREFEVLQLITKGRKTQEIANQLHVSVHTINSHRKNILKKLNLKSPAELIVYAMESGLVRV